MKYWRCQCGKREGWTTDGFARCTGCEECGTTLAPGPNSHYPLEDHQLVTRYDEWTGAPKSRYCVRCHRSFPLEETPDDLA